MARLAEPLEDRRGPELDDDGNPVEAVFRSKLDPSAGVALFRDQEGYGWLERVDLIDAMPDPATASWERPRALGDTYWTVDETVH